MTVTDGPAHSTHNASQEADVRARIASEYREMPGLKITLAQASRLFDLDHHRCARALNMLVDGGVLRTDGRTFLRAQDGRHAV